ncbi:MAG: hypothetical protein ACJA0M_002708, partial [Chitinophagales bacterium]
MKIISNLIQTLIFCYLLVACSGGGSSDSANEMVNEVVVALAENEIAAELDAQD